MSALPAWAAWPTRPSGTAAYTIGVEEEVMLVSPGGWNLAQASDEILPRLPPDVRDQFHPETHAAAVEIATGVHVRVADAIAELRRLRDALRITCEQQELAVASAGTHPFAVWRETAVGRGVRQAEVYGSMRELARREPTFALHVHVGMPDPEAAIRALDRLRVHLRAAVSLIAATLRRRVPLADRVEDLLGHLRPHAVDLGCLEELEGVGELLADPAAERQLRIARRPARLPGLVQTLAEAF